MSLRRFYLIAAGLLIADQFVKELIRSTMSPGDSVTILPHVLSITYIQNRGAAFGLFPSGTLILTLVSLVVCVVLVIFARTLFVTHPLLKYALALQLGGGLGNLLDRLRLGHVTDFIDFHVWPVFNLADIALTVGVGIMGFEILRQEMSPREG